MPTTGRRDHGHEQQRDDDDGTIESGPQHDGLPGEVRGGAVDGRRTGPPNEQIRSPRNGRRHTVDSNGSDCGEQIGTSHHSKDGPKGQKRRSGHGCEDRTHHESRIGVTGGQPRQDSYRHTCRQEQNDSDTHDPDGDDGGGGTARPGSGRSRNPGAAKTGTVGCPSCAAQRRQDDRVHRETPRGQGEGLPRMVIHLQQSDARGDPQHGKPQPGPDGLPTAGFHRSSSESPDSARPCIRYR